MNVLLTLLIVAAGQAAPTNQRYPSAVEVYHCGFEDNTDPDYDGWPEGWTRRRGLGYPQYLKVQLSEEPSSQGTKCLRMDLDGGAATAYSPALEANRRFSYVLEGHLKTDQLQRDKAYFSVTFLDEAHHQLETYFSKKVRTSNGWLRLRLGPIACGQETVRYAVIGLHLEPDEGVDLKGAALFDDIWFARVPRLTLGTDLPGNVFAAGQPVTIRCEVAGLGETASHVKLHLFDALGNSLASIERPLATDPANAPPADKTTEAAIPDACTVVWQPPIKDVGFYRIRVELPGDEGLGHNREITLAVINPSGHELRGEFGWSLPRGADPLSLERLVGLLQQVGIHWVKFPFWLGAQDEARIDELVSFTDQLTSHGIHIVGVLDRPPDEVRTRLGLADDPAAANVFKASADNWYPSLEPVLSRFALKVRSWQLGGDRDVSFVGYSNLVAMVSQVKEHLDRIGQDTHLGLAWAWTDACPGVEKPPWRFLSMWVEPTLTAEELATHLDHVEKQTAARWVAVQPLESNQYNIEVRVRDLVQRMLAAKIHGADVIFLPEPFSSRHGLMNDDGTPGELLLPWTTTARTLSGAEYLGQITLPGGSHNHLFARGGQVVMVVWNDLPTEEVIYLGEDVRQFDVWGRSRQPDQQGPQQVIQVGTLPTFITGVSLPVTRWRMACEFARPQLPNVLGVPHANAIHVENFFDGVARGTFRLVTADSWKTNPESIDVNLELDAKMNLPFELTLPLNANTGKQPVRVDFDITADRAYKFSVYREIEVGLGDVLMEIASYPGPNESLEVEQRLINRTDENVSFRCHLFAPNRRRMSVQVLNLPRGEDVKTFQIRDGQSLLGQTLWIRAEEIGGRRVLSYRFVGGQDK